PNSLVFQMGPGGNKKKKPAARKDKNKVLQKVNPFDLKFTKSKHNVLGKNKNQAVGAPMKSRKRALDSREKTLALEYKSMNKSNKLMDKRLGEKDRTLTEEEKAAKRFTEERLSSMKKKDIFNLNDDAEEETLTHGGRALTAIEKFDRVIESDDEDEGMTSEMAASIQFGGGDLDKGKPKDRKDLIAEMVSKSKQIKLEKSNAKDEQMQLTENLDGRLKALMMKGSLIQQKKEDLKKKIRDDYDDILTSLKFTNDKVTAPTNAKKTEAEEAEDEKKRLEKLEDDRKMRMTTKTSSTHFSADDDSVKRKSERPRKENNGFELIFDEEGKQINKKVDKNEKRRLTFDEESDCDDEELEDEEEDLEELMESGEDEDEEEEEVEEPPKKKSKKKEDTKKKNGKIVLADLPFTFSAPNKYADFMKLIDSMETQCIPTLVERLVKCFHPSLKEGNKAILERVFLFLLRLFTETSRKVPTKENIERIESLFLPIHTLLKLNREWGVKCIRSLIRSEWRRVEKGGISSPPTFTLSSSIRLVSLLFPVSDVWHPVCTPTLLVATRALVKYPLVCLSTLTRQLFLLSTLSEYINEIHRFIPEAVSFLRGCLCLAVEGETRVPSTVFPVSFPHSKMLVVDKPSSGSITPIVPEEVFTEHAKKGLVDTPLNRIRVLKVVIVLLRKFMLIYLNHPTTFSIIFKPLSSLLSRIPLSHLPSDLKEDIVDLISSMDSNCKEHEKIVHVSRKKGEQNMLMMVEPAWDDDFDPENKFKNRQNAPDAMSKKMSKMIKKEKRGAIKEIRKDNTFIAHKKAQSNAALDRDRKRKTKRLMASLQSQEGEHRRMEVKKKWQKR
ncbi:nol-14, partial [Pristionchus pacificus]